MENIVLIKTSFVHFAWYLFFLFIAQCKTWNTTWQNTGKSCSFGIAVDALTKANWINVLFAYVFVVFLILSDYLTHRLHNTTFLLKSKVFLVMKYVHLLPKIINISNLRALINRKCDYKTGIFCLCSGTALTNQSNTSSNFDN